MASSRLLELGLKNLAQLLLIHGCPSFCPLCCRYSNSSICQGHSLSWSTLLLSEAPTCTLAQTVQAISCNTGCHSYKNTESLATQSQLSAAQARSSSNMQALYNKQAEHSNTRRSHCNTRRDDRPHHKNGTKVAAADIQAKATDTWSKCVVSHDCRSLAPG
ncbi:hypothetical protein ACOSQ4_017626 [Xanthoceras sorbifolium]